MKQSWGRLPGAVKALITAREWHQEANLKGRLLGQRAFPIRVSLLPPSGRAALQDMAHFQTFVAQWRACEPQSAVQWESRTWRTLSEQSVPCYFQLNNIKELIECVGEEAQQRSRKWAETMSPLLAFNQNIYPALVKHLATVELMTPADAIRMVRLLEQLYAGMGAGQYLRALPLVGVDTKFAEQYQALITDLLNHLHNNDVAEAGGLHAWLGCSENPKGWLSVRPLCDNSRAALAGLPILQLPTDVLREHELPAGHILVVENMQSGLGLPALDDTIAVFGGGKHVAWMDADWLNTKRVAYWGDIDTWGLSILSDVREKCAGVEALMMDDITLRAHETRRVTEPEPVPQCPMHLTESEIQLFNGLKNGQHLNSRLEQERLSPDFIRDKLRAWRFND
ncbi:MAG: DUF3322 domain-containing protein [Pontibacterium sp.]